MTQERFTWQGYDGNSPAHRTLQGFLVMDVQYSSASADEMYSKIKAYTQGVLAQFDGCGNGYEFECRPEGLYLDCLFAGDSLTPVTVEYASVLQALSEWSAMCRKLEKGIGGR